MSLSVHLQELKQKHQALSERVEALERSPGSSRQDISRLKKQKLRLKDEIERKSKTQSDAAMPAE